MLNGRGSLIPLKHLRKPPCDYLIAPMNLSRFLPSSDVRRTRYLLKRSHELFGESGRRLTVAHQFPVVLAGAGAGPPSFGGAQPSTKVIEMVATVNTIRIPRNIFIPLAKGQNES